MAFLELKEVLTPLFAQWMNEERGSITEEEGNFKLTVSGVAIFKEEVDEFESQKLVDQFKAQFTFLSDSNEKCFSVEVKPEEINIPIGKPTIGTDFCLQDDDKFASLLLALAIALPEKRWANCG